MTRTIFPVSKNGATNIFSFPIVAKHAASVAFLAGPSAPVPVVGVPSASAVSGSPTHRAGYHVFDFDMTDKGVAITGRTRGLQMDGKIGDLGPINLRAPVSPSPSQ